MDIIKKVALQGFSISMLALAVAACGGSSDDSAPAVTPTPPASVTTATDVAKAAAAVIAASTAFDVVIGGGKDGIEEVITEGKADKDISCGTSLSAGKLKVTTNTSTAYPKDGTDVSSMCLESGEKFDGTLVYQCNDATCDNSVATATNYVLGNTTTGVDLKVNGTLTATDKDNYKGVSTVLKGGSAINFTFNDGLVFTYPSHNTVGTDSFGKLVVSGGSAFNCIDGELSYAVTTPLTTPSGPQVIGSGAVKISVGGSEVGTVTFNADDSVSVKMKDGSVTPVTKDVYQSYCGLKEVFSFSAN